MFGSSDAAAIARELQEKMMGIDYEAEYNNRGRVPGYQAIFKAWEAEAVAYRTEMTRTGRAEFGIRYGDSPRQIIDLFTPGSDDAPLALFIHGGYWRSLDPSLFHHMARGAQANGVIVAMSGYDLCPQVTIAQIIAQTRNACLHLWRRFGRRIMVYGHSAGGHLAACMLATDWKALAPDAPVDLVPAAYAISGIFDVAPLIHNSMNAELRLDAEQAREVSPLYWPVTAGGVLDAVVGAEESNEFLRQSRIIAEAWRQGEVETRYEAVAGRNHFTVIDLLADPKSAMSARVVELARRAAA